MSQDEEDYNDGTQNDRPIGNLNARYRCFPGKPFHDVPPIFKRRLTKGTDIDLATCHSEFYLARSILRYDVFDADDGGVHRALGELLNAAT